MRIASFNIEKNGQSSTLEKQTQVNGFIDLCSKELNVHLVFICEVHSSRLDDFTGHLSTVYSQYHVFPFKGGYSNGYIVMADKTVSIAVDSQGKLLGLTRPLIAATAESVAKYTGYILLAHFKSGQTDLTKKQINECAEALGGRWVITGDLNYDVRSVESLNPPGLAYDCWKGEMTHAKGGILDWVLASPDVAVEPVDLTGLKTFFDMTGPDHRPIIFDVYNKT